MKKGKDIRKSSNKVHKTQKHAPGLPSGSHSFQKLITGGIALSAATLAISLFAYFQPDTIVNIAEAVRHDTETSLPETGNQASPGQDGSNQASAGLDGSNLASPGLDGSNLASPGQISPAGSGQTAGEPADSESVPFLETSNELGKISNLTMEGRYDEELSIYSVMLDTSMGPMLYYNQSDVRWADYLYGGADPMKQYGCGPTAVSMVINSFSPDSMGVTPVELADWASANGEYAPQSGSYHSLVPNALSAYGLTVESVKNHSHDTAADLLGTGHILTALMGKGSLTENGHFILITKLLDNGNVHIADPNSYDNSTKEWSLDQLLSELKGSYDGGGPLWAVSLPAAD